MSGCRGQRKTESELKRRTRESPGIDDSDEMAAPRENEGKRTDAPGDKWGCRGEKRKKKKEKESGGNGIP